MTISTVWLFNAPQSQFPGAVFSSVERATAWIAKYRLTGVLTAYPVDEGVYDWAIAAGVFPASKLVNARFVGSFTSAHQEHHHFIDGVAETNPTAQ